MDKRGILPPRIVRPKKVGVTDVLKEVPGTVRGMGQNLLRAVDPAGLVVGGIKKYKDFAAKDRALNDAASKELGNVASNEGNMNELIRIKRKLSDRAKNATTTPGTK